MDTIIKEKLNNATLAPSSAGPSPIETASDSSSRPLRLPYRGGDVVLRDGSTVRIRVMQTEDEEQLFGLFRSLSDESRWLRFFSPGKESVLAAEAHRESNLDGASRCALLAITGTEERVVGHAFYSAVTEKRAEVAFAVADDFQGRGLGTILLGQLAEIAATNGIDVFEAELLASNHAMLKVFRESGFHIEVSAEAGQLRVTFPTSLTREAVEVFENREAIAAVNALKLFFNPRAIAVIGASRKRGSIGGEVFHNLLSYGFQGPVYPVNASTEVVQCVSAYPSVEDIPGPVDLAIIVVPAAAVIEAAAACGRKGVKALVVISAGFAETGPDGFTLQSELLKVCRAAGMRLIGPNCMGIVNTEANVQLDATFAPTAPPRGRVGFSSQSGALGLAIIEYASSLGLGLSTFVSVGNKADISGNDLLRYWESDPDTDVILLYLESFGNPRKFSQIARRVARHKPIVVVKSGRSSAGARASSSHTGAMLAASDVTVNALFRQSGIIRTDTLEELFDVASLVVSQPLPKGKRVAIITNAGGPGILCADACETRGLEIPILDQDTQKRLREFLPAGASVSNPVDMIASASAHDYQEAIRLAGKDPNIDSLIVIFTPPLVTKAEDVARSIVAGAESLKGEKPVLAVFLAATGVNAALKNENIHIPSFRFPETAAIALSRTARYREWRDEPEPDMVRLPDIKRDEAAALVASALTRGDGWLSVDETSELFACYGLPLVKQQVVNTPEEAGMVADFFEHKVALKAISPDLIHKTEAGAIKLNLSGSAQVFKAAKEMQERLSAAGHQPEKFLVQCMDEGGVEMLVGVVHDPQFGPLVACGAGGTQVELLGDVAVRLAPLTKKQAAQMIRGLKTYPLLTGFRGRAACDIEALEESLLRVSMLVDDIPQIAELDCNPLVVHSDGAVILDARVRVASVGPRPLIGVRH